MQQLKAKVRDLINPVNTVFLAVHLNRHEALVASHNCTFGTAIDSRRSTVDRSIKVSSVRRKKSRHENPLPGTKLYWLFHHTAN